MPLEEAMADRAWVGYHPRTALPLLVAAISASVTLLIGRWYLEDFSIFLNRAGALALYFTVFALWPCLFALQLYRMTTYSYRLCNRELLIDRGPFCNREEPIPLDEISAVESGASLPGTWVGVGWIKISTRAARVVMLRGVRNPGAFAKMIKG